MSTIIGHNHFLQKINKSLEKDRLHPVWLVEGCLGIGKYSYVLSVICPVISKLHKTELYVLNAESELEYFYHDATSLESSSQNFTKKDLTSQNQTITDNYFFQNTSSKKQSNDLGNISISKVREVISHLNYKSSSNNLRIVIIDSINELSQAGLQALLKTLEETNSNTIFFLICHSLRDIPKTILSRAIKIKLNNPSFTQFKQIIANKYPNIDDKSLSDVYYMSCANPRLAFKLLNNPKNIYLIEELFRHFVANDTSYRDLKELAINFDNIQKEVNTDISGYNNTININDLSLIVVEIFTQSLIQGKHRKSQEEVDTDGINRSSKIITLASQALRGLNFDKRLVKLKKIQSLLINNHNLKPSHQIIAAVFSLR